MEVEWRIGNKAVVGVLAKVDCSMLGRSSEHDEGANFYQFSPAHNASREVVPHGRAAICRKTIQVEVFGNILQPLIILDCCVIGIEHVNDAADVGLDCIPYFEAVISVVVVR